MCEKIVRSILGYRRKLRAFRLSEKIRDLAPLKLCTWRDSDVEHPCISSRDDVPHVSHASYVSFWMHPLRYVPNQCFMNVPKYRVSRHEQATMMALEGARHLLCHPKALLSNGETSTLEGMSVEQCQRVKTTREDANSWSINTQNNLLTYLHEISELSLNIGVGRNAENEENAERYNGKNFHELCWENQDYKRAWRSSLTFRAYSDPLFQIWTNTLTFLQKPDGKVSSKDMRGGYTSWAVLHLLISWLCV